MRSAILLIVSALTFAGCATIQARQTRATEQLLTEAGFEMTAAETPEALAQLETLPPRKIAFRPENRESPYVYADPTVCKCLYVGTEQSYQDFLKLQREGEMARERFRAADRYANPFFRGSWGWGTWPSP